jgi:16S rRNA pseudouridine516 synthase
MFGSCGATVVGLHRVSMGNLTLPDDLPVGEMRELTEEELKLLEELV